MKVFAWALTIAVAILLGSTTPAVAESSDEGGSLMQKGVQGGVDMMRDEAEGTDNTIDDSAVDGVQDELDKRGWTAGRDDDEADDAAEAEGDDDQADESAGLEDADGEGDDAAILEGDDADGIDTVP